MEETNEKKINDDRTKNNDGNGNYDKSPDSGILRSRMAYAP